MKNKHLIIAGIASIIFCSCERSEFHHVEGKIDEGKRVSYWTKRDGTLDGPFLKYYSSGHQYSMVQYIAGKPDGILLEYYDTQRLKLMCTFKNGIKEGFRYRYYPNGKKQDVAYFERDFLKYLEEYDENGNLSKDEGHLPFAMQG